MIRKFFKTAIFAGALLPALSAGAVTQGLNPAIAGVSAATVFGGISIKPGDNLVEVLTQATGVTYEYNADYGILAAAGNWGIEIQEEELSEKGHKIIDSLTSDIELDVPLAPDCFLPTAKVSVIVPQ